MAAPELTPMEGSRPARETHATGFFRRALRRPMLLAQRAPVHPTPYRRERHAPSPHAGCSSIRAPGPTYTCPIGSIATAAPATAATGAARFASWAKGCARSPMRRPTREQLREALSLLRYFATFITAPSAKLLADVPSLTQNTLVELVARATTLACCWAIA